MTLRLVLVFLTSVCALAQAPAGAIQGLVVDASGAGVAGVNILLSDVERGGSRQSQTDGEGRFYVSGLQAGQWTLRMARDGFATLNLPAFPISIGQTLSQRWTLSLKGVAESIEVREQPDVLEAAASSASVALGGDRIEEAPARGRNYLGFVSLAPGLVQSSGSAQQRTMTGIRSPLADSGFSFAGIRARNNGISIDGVDNRDETTGGNRVAIGLEMVQEFRVAGVSAGAEFGGAAGGLINVVTRTGVNLWHGDATWFWQDEFWNARKSEAEVPSTPEYHRRQPGASLLGPVRRDRTFFGIAAELEKEAAQEWSETPEYAVARINRVMGRSAVYRGLYPTSQRGTDVTSKFNHQISQKDTLALRYAWSHGSALGDVQGTDNFLDWTAAGNSLTADHSLAGSWMHVGSGSVVNEVRGQYGRREQRLWPNGSGPLIEIPGVVSFGTAPRLNAVRDETHAEAVEQLNLNLGHHRLSAGASAHAVWFDGRLAYRFAGVAVYPTLEDFEQHRPDLSLRVAGEPHTSMTTVPLGLWLQERWQVREGLLLEAGLRYDRQTLPVGLPAANSVSPRAGLAWRPSPGAKWVLRAGFGLFYDRFPLAYLNDFVQKGSGHAVEYVRWGSEPEMTARWAASQKLPPSYGRKVSIGWERGFGSTATLHLEANFVRGAHLPRVRNAAFGARPLYLLEQNGNSDYRGMSVSYNRRVVRGVAILTSFDLGRAYDDGSDFDEQPSRPGDLRAEWGRSRQYQARRFSFSSVFELPFGKLGGPDWLREALQEWTLAPAFVAGSGRSLNTLMSSDVYRTAAYPLSARPEGFARNSALGPASVNLDARLMKTIPFGGDRSRLQFGVEAFNALNHPNAVRVSETWASPSGRLGTWRSVVESVLARQIQLFAQYEF